MEEAEAEALGYSSRKLSLGIQMHLAPRGVRCYAHSPGVTIPSNVIIAGCTQSTTFTKVYVHGVLQGFRDKYQT